MEPDEIAEFKPLAQCFCGVVFYGQTLKEATQTLDLHLRFVHSMKEPKDEPKEIVV